MSEIKRYDVTENIYEAPRAGAAFTVVMAADHDAEVARHEKLRVEGNEYIANLQRENSRLRAELERWREWDTVKALIAERDSLRLDAERLRAELDRIAKDGGPINETICQYCGKVRGERHWCPESCGQPSAALTEQQK